MNIRSAIFVLVITIFLLIGWPGEKHWAGACLSAAQAVSEQDIKPSPTGQHEMSEEDKADAQIGKSASEELEKQVKLVKEPPELPHIMEVISYIRPLTQKPYINYQVKVIDSKAVNAFSLPGGYLYYTQGLLDAIESDDELAGISAHEMAHIALSHSRKLMRRDRRYQQILAPVILAAILADPKGVDPGAVAAVGGLVVQDALNHYGREAEYESDHQAVLYLAASKRYHPVGLLTVLEGLARIEEGQSAVEMGALQTHPVPKDRIQVVVHQLTELKIPIERRRATKSLVASAIAVTSEGKEIGQVRLNNRVIFEPAAELDGLSPVIRSQRSANILTTLLLANLELLEISQLKDSDRVVIQARGETILTISSADVAFHKTTLSALAEKTMQAIRLAFQEEKISRAY